MPVDISIKTNWADNNVMQKYYAWRLTKENKHSCICSQLIHYTSKPSQPMAKLQLTAKDKYHIFIYIYSTRNKF